MPGLRSQADLPDDVWEDHFRGSLLHWGGMSVPEQDPDCIHAHPEQPLRCDLSRWSKIKVPCRGGCGVDVPARNKTGYCRSCHATATRKKGG